MSTFVSYFKHKEMFYVMYIYSEPSDLIVTFGDS